MLRRVAVYARPDLEESIRLARRVYEALGEMGVEAFYDLSIAGLAGGRGLDLRFAEVDGVVVIGGDGTLLRLLQLLGGRSPVLHLIRMGHRAFLFEEDAETGLSRLRDFVEERFRVEEHRRLLVRHGGFSYYALNEAVVTALGSKVVYLDVQYSGAPLYEDMAGDGVIVATPIGSTAYSFSAGGPVLHPGLDAVAVTPLNPVDRCLGSVVVPGWGEVTIRVRHTLRPVKLIVDGAKEQLLTRGAVVTASLRGPPVRIARYRGEGGKLRLPWRRG